MGLNLPGAVGTAIGVRGKRRRKGVGVTDTTGTTPEGTAPGTTDSTLPAEGVVTAPGTIGTAELPGARRRALKAAGRGFLGY